MRFAEAKVADLLRSHQRDEAFVQEMQNSIQSVLKIFGGARSHQGQQKNIPVLTNAWYYFMTTLGNLQTLGEEYTGTLRVNSEARIPSKIVQLLWLCFYIGGEPLMDKLMSTMEEKLNKSEAISERAKGTFVKCLNFLQSNKQTFKRIHHSLFYIDGKFYNISNRITGIQYVLVREWMQDETFTNGFKFIGHLSLCYLVLSLLQELWTKSSGSVGDNKATSMEVSRKGCVLCAEGRKNPCATPCGHIFCWDCIFDSLNYQQMCPVCREGVNSSRIIFLQNYL